MRKIWILMLAMIFGLLFSLQTNAAEDTSPPLLKSVKVLTDNVKVGDPIRIQIEVEESGTGLSSVDMDLGGFANGSWPWVVGTSKEWNTPQYSQGENYISYIFEIPTTSDDIHNGQWFVTRIDLRDVKGNYISYELTQERDTLKNFTGNDSNEISGQLSFTITGVSQDDTAPVINWIKIRDNSLEKPGKALIDINVTEENDISFLGLNCDKTNGGSSVQVELSDLKCRGTKTITVEVAIGKNAHTGLWCVSQITLSDSRQNTYVYVDGYLDKQGYLVNIDNPEMMLPSVTFHVLGIGGDETKPKTKQIIVSDGHKTVKKPGFLTFDVEFEEEESGIIFFEVRIDHADGAYGNSTTQTYYFYAKGYENDLSVPWTEATPFENPLATGTYTFSIPIGSSMANGTYRVYITAMQDRASNKYADYAEESYSHGADFIVEDEFDYDFEMGISNPALLSKIQAMEEGKVARILLSKNNSNILSKEIFDAIAGKNVKLVCYIDGYQWIIDGNTIDPGQTKDIDLDVKVTSIDGENLSSGKEAIGLYFADNGTLPGPIQFRFKSAFIKEFVGREDTLHLYHVNEENGEGTAQEEPVSETTGDEIDYISDTFEEEKNPNFEVIIDDKDAWCYVDLSHNSKFIVSGTPLSKLSLSKAVIKGPAKSYIYTGRYIKPAVKVQLAGKTLKAGRDYKVTYSGNKNVGKAGITITGLKVPGKRTIYFNIKKASNKLTAKGKTVKVPYKKLKKKKQIISRKKTIKVTKQTGKLTFKKVSGNKKIRIAGNGSITLPKKLKKGSYKIRIKVSAAGNKNIKSAAKNVTVKIIVK